MRSGPRAAGTFLAVVGTSWAALLLLALAAHRAIGVEAGRLAESGAAFDAEAWAAARRGGLWTAAAVAALLAVAPGWAIARRRGARLRETLAFADALLAGQVDAPPPPEATDELTDVVTRLRGLAASIRARVARSVRNEKELRTILAGMAEGVVAVDARGRVILLNDAAADMLRIDGLAEGEAVEELDGDLEIAAVLRRCIEQSESATEERRVQRAGRKKHIELKASPLRDSEKRITGAVAVMHDVTSLKLAEKMRRDFVANVSHELKTPLTAIHGAAATLIDSPDMPSETRAKFVMNIHRNAERLEQLITDILELSRIQQGADRLEYEKVDFARLINDVVGRVRAQAEAKGLLLDWRRPEAPALMLADRSAATSIVENLCSNAIRYTPSGGRVEIVTEETPESMVLIVRDTGIGIAEKHIDRIFERFYRIDKARSRQQGGTGLGLAIVKNYVQAHGGEITVESVEGEGTTFRVVLPRRL